MNPNDKVFPSKGTIYGLTKFEHTVIELVKGQMAGGQAPNVQYCIGVAKNICKSLNDEKIRNRW